MSCCLATSVVRSRGLRGLPSSRIFMFLGGIETVCVLSPSPGPWRVLCLDSVDVDSRVCQWLASTRTSRVPGLPMRDCAGSCKRSVPRCAKVSTIDVTAKTMVERLNLVSGRTPIYAPSQMTLCTQTYTTHFRAISRIPWKKIQQENS